MQVVMYNGRVDGCDAYSKTNAQQDKQAGRRTYLQGVGDGETHKTSGDVIIQHGEQRGKHHDAVA